MKNTYAIVWEFRERPDSLAEFEKRYGPDGDWAKLFRGSAGFIETLLFRDLKTGGTYTTVDRWQSEEAFLKLRATWESEYLHPDRESSGLTLNETPLALSE